MTGMVLRNTETLVPNGHKKALSVKTTSYATYTRHSLLHSIPPKRG
jgi:hypothetical protein